MSWMLCAYLNPDIVGSIVKACDWVLLQPLLPPHYVDCPGHVPLSQRTTGMLYRLFSWCWCIITNHRLALTRSLFLYLCCVCAVLCKWRHHRLTGLRPRSVQISSLPGSCCLEDTGAAHRWDLYYGLFVQIICEIFWVIFTGLFCRVCAHKTGPIEAAH